MRIQNPINTQYMQTLALNQNIKANAHTRVTQTTPTSDATKRTIDSVILSNEQMLQEQTSEEKQTFNELIEKKNAELENLKFQMDQANTDADLLKDQMKILSKCIVIALRISSGDTVPPADYKFLAENQPKLYSASIQLRVTKENPKKYKQLSEKEDADKNMKAMDPDKKNTDAITSITKPKNDLSIVAQMLRP